MAVEEGETTPADGDVLLRDCVDLDAEGLKRLVERGGAGAKTVLFNVLPGSGIEPAALNAGFLGVFYATDSLEILGRGVRAVLGGELWFSRSTFTRCVRERTPARMGAGRERVGKLTPREVEVLGFLALGATNEMIAEEFCISVATVKTHLYRIYKKISVSNRLQAVFWATQNI